MGTGRFVINEIWLILSYGESLTILFMLIKSRDPVIRIFITWSRDHDSNAINRLYKKTVNHSCNPDILKPLWIMN